MCCAHDFLVVEVLTMFLQCALLGDHRVFLPCCVRDGVWRGTARNSCMILFCTEAFDPPTATVDAAVLQQMTYENTHTCTVVTVRGSGPPTCA